MAGFLDEPIRIHELSGGVSKYPPFMDEFEYSFHTSGLQYVDRDGYQHPVWRAHVCMSCHAASVWRGDALVWPPAGRTIEPHADMPSAVRSLFTEAADTAATSPRAAAALARAAMEMLLKHQFPDSSARDLNQRVAELKPLVSNALWQVLTVLRVVGNEALHDGTITIDLDGGDNDLIESLLGSVNQLVDELISRPARAQALYSKLPEGKRAGAEAAAKKVSDRG